MLEARVLEQQLLARALAVERLELGVPRERDAHVLARLRAHEALERLLFRERALAAAEAAESPEAVGGMEARGGESREVARVKAALRARAAAEPPRPFEVVQNLTRRLVRVGGAPQLAVAAEDAATVARDHHLDESVDLRVVVDRRQREQRVVRARARVAAAVRHR